MEKIKNAISILAEIMLMCIVLALISKGASAATVNTTSGTFATLYSTVMGFIFGGPGIIVAILMGLFGVIMMVSKHWTAFIVVMIALIIFFMIPNIVTLLATAGATAAGAII